MNERHDNPWPIVVGLFVAVAIHFAAVSSAAYWLDRETPDDLSKSHQNEMELGRHNTPQPVAAAWIGYEAFQQLIAPKSITEQPALQRQAQPIPNAPLEPDPTPPEVFPRAIQPPEILPQNPPTPIGGPLPPQTSSPPPPQASPLKPQASPTSIPRDEGESAPVTRADEKLEVHPGAVMTGPGIEIKTARPRFSAIARASTIPDGNPIVEITFDATGTVIYAKLTRSTGSDNLDAPILASLYKWKAKGQRIDDLKDPLIFQITLLLRDE